MLQRSPHNSYSVVGTTSKFVPFLFPISTPMKILPNLFERAIRQVKVPEALSETKLLENRRVVESKPI